MKFSIVAALVVLLAIGHGTESASLVKRDIPVELQKITQFITDMSASVTSAGQEMVDKVKALELPNTAQTYFEGGKAQIEPLVGKVQAEAEKLQDQLKPYISNIEEQLKPLTDNLQAQLMPLADNFNAQVKPLADNFQAQVDQIFKQVLAQTMALLPPQ